MSAYLVKALREAKLHTSWININEPYERACAQFLRRLMGRDPTENPFLADLRAFLPRVAIPGLYNALAQVVLKVTAPGVPDFYQGTELWDFSLVDPDNRRPVDYQQRRALMRELGALEGDALRARIATARARPADGALKLLVTMRTLAHRRRHRAFYEGGAYVPLPVEGPRAHHVVAFARVAATGAPPSPSSVASSPRSSGAPAPSYRRRSEGLGRDPRPASGRACSQRYREIISGADLVPAVDRKSLLPVGKIFSMLPVAILAPRLP